MNRRIRVFVAPTSGQKKVVYRRIDRFLLCKVCQIRACQVEMAVYRTTSKETTVRIAVNLRARGLRQFKDETAKMRKFWTVMPGSLRYGCPYG